MIITLDSISKPESIVKIAQQLMFLFNKLEIECTTIADRHIIDISDLDKQLLNYKSHKVFLLLPLANKQNIKAEMMINSHLVCTFIDDFIGDLPEIALSANDQYDDVIPGKYSAYVWEQKKNRAKYTKSNFNWKIYKNYSAVFQDGKKINSEAILRKIARKIGTKIEQGVSNLGCFDKENLFTSRNLNISQVVAKQEIIGIMQSFDSKFINSRLIKNL